MALFTLTKTCQKQLKICYAYVAQQVAHVLGKKKINTATMMLDRYLCDIDWR